MSEQVRDLMTGPPVMVEPGAPVVEVARLMRDEGLGAVLVEENGLPRALITDRDLTVRVLADGGDVTAKSVQVAYSDPLISVAPDDDAAHAVQLMRANAVRRLPVIDDGGRAVGVVSLGDLAVERDPDSALGEISAAPANS